MHYIVIGHGQTEIGQPEENIFYSIEYRKSFDEAKSLWNYRVLVDMRKGKLFGSVSLYEVAEYTRETGAFVLGAMLLHEAAELKVIKRYNAEKAVKA